MDTIFVLNCNGIKGIYFLFVARVGLLEYELKISILHVPLLFNGSFSKCYCSYLNFSSISGKGNMDNLYQSN